MTTRWFLEAGVLGARSGLDPRDWVPGADGRPVWCPALGGSGIPSEEFRRALRMATEEPCRTILVPGSAWQVGEAPPSLRVCRTCGAHPQVCGHAEAARMRLAGPSLYDLRQAWLDTGTMTALLAFQAALAAVEFVSDLDALDEACAEPGHDPAVDVAALVAVVAGLAAWFTLFVAAVSGHLAEAAAGWCVLLGAGLWLRRAAPVLRRRRR